MYRLLKMAAYIQDSLKAPAKSGMADSARAFEIVAVYAARDARYTCHLVSLKLLDIF
jgi:hypothetical protein